MSSNEHNYLILYRLSKNFIPYQPTSRWCKTAQFKVEELLHHKDKSKFVPDEILYTKREFIKDNF